MTVATGRSDDAGGPGFSPVAPVRLSQRIVEQVEEAVARGELRPGARLGSERSLVESFGTSRATVREALRVLEGTGVVRSRQGDPRGPEVLGFSPAALGRQLTRLARLDDAGPADLVGFRMILDGSAALLAARLRTEDQLAALAAAVQAMADAVDLGGDGFTEADVGFHEALAAASGNTLLVVGNAVVREVVGSLIAGKVAAVADPLALMRVSLGYHQDVLDAVAEGDGHRAADLSRRALLGYYGPHLSPAEREALAGLLADGGPATAAAPRPSTRAANGPP